MTKDFARKKKKSSSNYIIIEMPTMDILSIEKGLRKKKRSHRPTINMIIEIPTMDILSIDKGFRKKKKEVILQLLILSLKYLQWVGIDCHYLIFPPIYLGKI